MWLDYVQLDSAENIGTVSTEQQRDTLREELSEVGTAHHSDYFRLIARMTFMLSFFYLSSTILRKMCLNCHLENILD